MRLAIVVFPSLIQHNLFALHDPMNHSHFEIGSRFLNCEGRADSVTNLLRCHRHAHRQGGQRMAEANSEIRIGEGVLRGNSGHGNQSHLSHSINSFLSSLLECLYYSTPWLRCQGFFRRNFQFLRSGDNNGVPLRSADRCNPCRIPRPEQSW